MGRRNNKKSFPVIDRRLIIAAVIAVAAAWFIKIQKSYILHLWKK